MRRLIILSVVVLSLRWEAAAIGRSSRLQHNLFDPIYAYDDIDAHTVSVEQNQRPSSPVQNKPELVRSRFSSPRIAGANQASSLASSSTVATRAPSSKPVELASSARQTATTRLHSTVSTAPALHTPQFSAAPASNTRVKKDQEPAHWSALENYYQKLRQQAAPTFLLDQQPPSYQQQQPAIYQIVQQESGDDQPISSYKQLQPTNSPPYAAQQPYFIMSSANGPILRVPADSISSRANPAFALPINDAPLNSYNGLSQAKPSDEIDYSLYQAPGISRKGGLSSNAKSDFAQFIAGQQSVKTAPSRDFPTMPALSSSYYVPSASPVVDDGGKIKYLGFKKLPESLIIQQQQQRVKHQQETFGSWYDHQRSREQLQEEAFCGQRNYINFQVVALPSSSSKSSSKGDKLQYTPLQVQLAGSRSAAQLDVPMTLSAGEYPSHMGLYNGSSPTEDNFLCAATWINEQFALTLASCVKSVADPKQLTVRAGEWNINKNKEDPTIRPLVTRQVEQVFTFPKNDSLDHNLALVKFTAPIDYLNLPYICPACQMQSRSTIRTSSCWTPVRNITTSEYFDADGEGETKERKNVNMIELPIKLIANDDDECYRQTRVEFFNFHHPNYICSGDYRAQNQWRARLNQTDYFGSGIYCNENGNLVLVSVLHPIHSNSSSAMGYLDLSYYKPWMRKVISGLNF